MTRTHPESVDAGTFSRAQGCLLGQPAGDALGSLVEFRTPQNIRMQYPGGVRELADGGTWNTIAGQPTDDSDYGRDAIPDQWAGRLLNCRPEAGRPNVYRPRPECLWPVDALDLAERLIH